MSKPRRSLARRRGAKRKKRRQIPRWLRTLVLALVFFVKRVLRELFG